MSALTTNRLETLEAVITKGQQTFVDVGNALAAIRDEQLFLDNFPNFKAYCVGRWGWSRQRGYQLIQAAEVVAALPPTLGSQVVDERDARALFGLKPDAQREAIIEAQKEGVSISHFCEKPDSIEDDASTGVDTVLRKKGKKSNYSKLEKRALELQQINEVLNARVEELEQVLNDYDSLVTEHGETLKVLESDDRVKTLMDENKKLREQLRLLNEHIASLQGSRNSAIQHAKAAQKKLAAYERAATTPAS